MESFTLNLLFNSLVSVTVSFTAVIIPFAGAVWIYKKTNLSTAESAIYQIGRDIAIVLHDATEIRSPLGAIVYSYIDGPILDIEEPNRDLAIHELVKKTYMELMRNSDNEDFDSRIAATLLIAITADRFANLVPPGIKWSGQGPVYSTFGEDISVEDNLFPFGTKLYRQWIERFSVIYKDLWVCTSSHSRRFYVKIFASKDEYTSEDDVNTWLDDVRATLTTVNALHSKLITQIQIIDSSINERSFRLSLVACSFFLVLLVLSGYFFPVFLAKIDERTWTNFSILTFASASLMLLIVSRLVSRYGQKRDSQVQREVFIPPLLKFLDEIKIDSLRFKHDRVDNVLSMKNDLNLPKPLCRLLSVCSDEMKQYNLVAQTYAKEAAELIPTIFHSFPSQRNNKGGFSISIAELAGDTFDLDAIGKRILSEDTNLFIEHKEQHSSRAIHTINLANLSSKQRTELLSCIREFQRQVRGLSSYKEFIACWSRLERTTTVLKENAERLRCSD